MHSRYYYSYLTYTKPYVDRKLAENRKAFIKEIKAKYPKLEDWHRIRFSNECHWTYGPEENIRILRKKGTRIYLDYIR